MQFILMHYIAGNPSFYKQAKERGNLILKIRDIYVVIILAIKFYCVCIRFLRQAKSKT